MSPKLIGLTGLSKGMTVILDENECSIGRAPSNQLCLGGDLVSRQRDLEEMMNERGLSVDHTTIYRSRAAVCAGIGEKITPSSAADQ
jgi:hypothetical protein